MAITNYYTAPGGILGEKVGVNTRTDYLTDGLGSVSATLDQGSSVQNTYRYKPFGGLFVKTGLGNDPVFGWRGANSLKVESAKYAEIFVIQGNTSTLLGAWDNSSATKSSANNIRSSSSLIVQGAHVFCTGCKDSTPPCNIPNLPGIDYMLCKYVGNILAELATNIFGNSDSNLCACSLQFQGKVTITINSGCFESTGSSSLMPVCLLPKGLKISCSNLQYSLARSCGQMANCKPICSPNVTTTPYNPNPMPSPSGPISGQSGAVTVKLSNLVATMVVNATMKVRSCVGNPKRASCPDQNQGAL